MPGAGGEPLPSVDQMLRRGPLQFRGYVRENLVYKVNLIGFFVQTKFKFGISLCTNVLAIFQYDTQNSVLDSDVPFLPKFPELSTEYGRLLVRCH